MSLYKDASLVMIPSAYKDGKLYSIRPTDGGGDFTFSRGSNLAATRVDVNGLIEKGRENVLVNSNAFSGSGWTTSNASVTGGQSDKDGGTNAWKLTASGTFAFVRQLGLSVNGVATASVYLKAGTTDWVNFRLSASANNQIYVNLSNGTFGTISASNLIDKSIEDVGGGWYRVSVVLNVSNLTGFYIYVADADNTLNTSNETIYFQDAQLEAGLVATDYIETGTSAAQSGILEDMPRLDYSGSCPALLLEPQRSNLVTSSEYIDGSAAWSLPNITIEDNSITSPEGLQNASKLTSTANFAKIYQQINLSATTTYTASFWVKDISAGSSLRANLYDLTNGTPLLNQNYSEDISTTEWRRLEFQFTTTTACTLQAQFVRDLNDGEEIYVWGFQLEAGSYPTSYIPTYGTSVTRSSDSCLATSVSDLIGQSQGTLFAEIDFQQTESSSRFIAVGDGTSANRIAIFTNSSNDGFRVFVNDNNSIQVDSSIAVSKGVVKLALAYANNDYVLYVNGVSRITDTNASVPACDNVYLGRQEISLTNVLGSGIKQAALFKTRLTNDELASLTTL